jgi:hypothetical protein
MNKGILFLGIFLSFLLLAPYLGIHPFGRAESALTKVRSESNTLPVRVEDLDLMDPVDPADIEE